MKWSEALAGSQKRQGPPFETDTDVNERTVAELLTGILQQIGLDPSAQVQASKANVASMAMDRLGLARGWLKECPKASGTVRLESNDNRGLRRSLEAAGHRNRRTFSALGLLGLVGLLAAAVVTL